MTHGTDSPTPARTGCAASARESSVALPSRPWAAPSPGVRTEPPVMEAAYLQALATRLREEAGQLRGAAQQARDEWRQAHDRVTRLVARIHLVEATLAETEAHLRAVTGAEPGRRELE